MTKGYYVITYRGDHDDHVRVMGFKLDLLGTLRIVEVLGRGASFEHIPGPYPHDELTAALAYEEHKRRHGLRLVTAV